jgi:hypothetical protein
MDQLKYNNESSLIPGDFISLYQKINTTTKSTEEVEEDTLIYGEYFKKLLNTILSFFCVWYPFHSGIEKYHSLEYTVGR